MHTLVLTLHTQRKMHEASALSREFVYENSFVSDDKLVQATKVYLPAATPELLDIACGTELQRAQACEAPTSLKAQRVRLSVL